MSPTWCRRHQEFIKMMSDTPLKSPMEATCSNNTHISDVLLRSSLWGMEGIKGERSEQQSDRAENHHQSRLYLGRFDVEKMRFVIKNVLCRYSELCFLCLRGAHFYKKGDANGREMKIGSETRSMASLRPICAGLVGPKSGNVDFI